MNTPQIRSARAICLTAALALTETSLSAQEIPAPTVGREPSKFALVAEAGTTGFGPALVFTVNPKFTLTLGYTWLDHDYDVESDDAEYDGKLKLSNFKALANWHPWSSAFHFSGGLFASDNQIDVTAKPKAGNIFEINGRDYGSSQITSLTGNASFEDDIAPYIGLGWAKSPANSGLAFYATIGVFFAGDASVRLSGQGTNIANNVQLQSDLRQEEREINDDLSDLAVYPVLQLGIQYRF